MRWRPLSWTAGRIDVSLAEGAHGSGPTSLLADNGCSIVLPLDADAATTLLAAWHAGLPQARATATVTADAATRSEAGTTTDRRLTAGERTVVSVAATATTSSPLTLTLATDLRLPAAARDHGISDLTL